MNFLAHIYLSGNNEMVTIGNFVADGMRGRKYVNYSNEMQVGILLHRAIDTYTDAHPVFRRSTTRLHKPYSHYSGVIVDIFYDHFLAKNWLEYSDISLDFFVKQFYESLERNFDILPPKFKHLSPFMINDNWLLGYAKIEGIQSVLNGMNRRTGGRSKMNLATKELQLFYEDFENDFTEFFNDLEAFSNNHRSKLIEQYNI